MGSSRSSLAVVTETHERELNASRLNTADAGRREDGRRAMGRGRAWMGEWTNLDGVRATCYAVARLALAVLTLPLCVAVASFERAAE